MELISKVMPADYTVVDTGDWHLGNVNAHIDGIKEAVKRAQEPDTYIVLKGDLLDAILPNDKRYAHCAVSIPTPAQSLDLLTELLQPVRGKILAVMLGNHCNSVDTELLTSEGWIRADQITYLHRIASINLATRAVNYGRPVYVGSPFVTDCVTLTSNLKDEYVAADHNFVYKGSLVAASHVPDMTENRDYLFSGIKHGGIRPFPEVCADEVRLLTWVIADGTIRRDEGIKCRVQFKLSKPRKIEALKALLDRMGVPYTFKPCKPGAHNVLQPYYIRMYGDVARRIWTLLDGAKEIPDWFINLPLHHMTACFETYAETDGCYITDNNILVSSSHKPDMDKLQIMAVHAGYISRLDLYESQQKGGFEADKTYKARYRLNLYKLLGTSLGGYAVTKAVAAPVAVVPIQSQDGTLVARRNGKVSVTGNCYKLINTINIAWELCQRLDAPYGGYACKFTALDERHKVRHKFFLTHGYGNLPAGAKDAIQRRANQESALKRRLEGTGHSDCIYMSMGHTHKLMVVNPTINHEVMLTDNGKKLQQQYRVHSAQNAQYIPPEARWYGCSGSMLKTNTAPGIGAISYSEVFCYGPSEMGWLEVNVRGGEVVGVEKVVT